MNEPDDRTWILQRERGEDVSHIPARTRAGYDRLAALIAALADETPDPGWKRRVFASLGEPPSHGVGSASRHRARHLVSLVMGGLAAAAAITLVLAWCHREIEVRPSAIAAKEPREPRTAVPERPLSLARPAMPDDEPLSVASVAGESVAAPLATAVIRRGDTPHRSSDGASIGDTLILSLEVDRPSELRVYGDAGEPLARCTETQGCTVERSGKVRRFQLQLVLRASGTVRAVLFTGDSIPESFRNLNTDMETAQRASVEARQVGFVQVQ